MGDQMISVIEKKFFFAFNVIAVIFVFCGFESNSNTRFNKKSQLCFTYAAKKCNFYNKDRAKLICNTLITHNLKISSIKNHKECRRGI